MDTSGGAVRSLVRRFLAEDVGRRDITTEAVVPAYVRGRTRIVAGTPGILAGLEVNRACFEELDGSLEWTSPYSDGDDVKPGAAVVSVVGSLRAILTAERTALNLLSRLSGVATATAELVELVKGHPVRIADTRKTTPGLRPLEKYAVRVGGGTNHRFGLDDGILIKDNHISAVGGIAEAVRRAKEAAPHTMRVEVEVLSSKELDEALSAGADAVLLDNMAVEEVRDAVARAGGKVLLEVSGNITRDNVAAYAATGVDVISAGAMTHSAPHIDFSLEVEA